MCMRICVRTYVYVYKNPYCIYWDISAVIPQHFDSASRCHKRTSWEPHERPWLLVALALPEAVQLVGSAMLGSFWKFLFSLSFEHHQAACAVVTTWTRKRSLNPPRPNIYASSSVQPTGIWMSVMSTVALLFEQWVSHCGMQAPPVRSTVVDLDLSVRSRRRSTPLPPT